MLELGCGPGRDSNALAARVARVRAVDHSRVAIDRPRSALPVLGGPDFRVADAIDAVRVSDSGSLDVAYAHALYKLLADVELDRLLEEIFRVRRPGGRHAFAVRSTTDPLGGEGSEVAPDVYVGGPHESPMRYYREATLGRFLAAGFEPVAEELATDVHLWCVAHERPSGDSGTPPEGLF